VSIGEVLSDARCRSGLSIGEVSRQTRIREEIVWAIELDDFAKCGGNLYARGYIRSIAAAVFVDPAPLIAEFDATHPAGQQPEPRGEPRPSQRTSRATSELLTLPELDAPEARHPLTRSERYRRRHRRRVILSTAMCLAVLVIFGGEAYHFAHVGANTSENAAQAAFNRATTKPQPSKKAKPSASASPTKPSPSATPTPTPTLQTLTPVSATAYGPWGVTGDNPQDADQAIDGSSSTAWQSDWYSSAHFGGLKSGTGLLLDFGKPVTIVSADLNLGTSGSYVELRGGNSSSPDALKIIGGTKNAGDSTTIRPQETPGRYLLVWITSLPETSSGSYQASLYNISFQGHS
jgi:cytoskeleton protein RodZ